MGHGRCGVGFQGLEAALAVLALPATQCGWPDAAASSVGDVVFLAGQLLQETAFLTGRVLLAQQRQDQGVSE
ncbi:MAG: hypothetical protein ACE5LU_01515 [Anaerolineae bacterium]